MTALASETRSSRSAGLLHCLLIKETQFPFRISSSIQRSGKVQSVMTTFCGVEFINVFLADCQYRSNGMRLRPTLFGKFSILSRIAYPREHWKRATDLLPLRSAAGNLSPNSP